MSWEVFGTDTDNDAIDAAGLEEAGWESDEDGETWWKTDEPDETYTFQQAVEIWEENNAE